MIIKVKDLQLNDDILVGSNSRFRWFKVVAPVKLNKTGRGYTSVRCSTKINITKVPCTKWDRALQKTVPSIREIKEYEATGDNHNTRVSVNLNYKDIWLLTRNGIRI